MMSRKDADREPQLDADVIVIGAGPSGLMTANLLAGYGVKVLVVEANAHIIDYPRGVGMDDETLRVFQTAGLADAVLPHTIPHQLLVFIDRKGRDLARISPPASDFGWPKRNGFVQPLADKVLLDGLRGRDGADVHFSTTVTGLSQDASGVQVEVTRADGAQDVLRAAYVVGADGGRSATRKALGVAFPGSSAKSDWIVIDIRNDPLGQPGAFVGADPKRPYVSISIPHGIRRFEFMMLLGETAQDAESDTFIRALLDPFVPHSADVDIIRRRVYTHQSRMAARFRTGRVFLVGDAAHVMPVWQGQGYNSGIRDAYNIAWKLAMVLRGHAGEVLLDSYDLERRDHVRAMIQLSTWVGRVISIRNRAAASARDVFFRSVALVPALKAYIVQMRFKPMPTMTRGAVTAVGSTGQGASVGRLFPQPLVSTSQLGTVKLDEAIGGWFALLAWNNDPRAILDPGVVAAAERAGVNLVEVRPEVQRTWVRDAAVRDDSGLVIGDAAGDLKRWFDVRPESVILIRPDRIVGGASPAHAADDMMRAFLRTIGVPVRAAGGAGRAAAVPAARAATDPHTLDDHLEQEMR